jgi:hypothetical protein
MIDLDSDDRHAQQVSPTFRREARCYRDGKLRIQKYVPMWKRRATDDGDREAIRNCIAAIDAAREELRIV